MPRKLPDEYDAWSTPDIAILSANYPQGGARSVQAKLPERSLKSIQCKARKAGLVYEHRRPWTKDDDARLRGNWGLEDVDDIAKMLGRTRLSIVFRAAMFGLERGAPEGWEYLSNAVARVGYGMESLRTILKWAGVRVLHSYSFTDPLRRGKRQKWRRHIVEPGDVNFAIEQWCATESLNVAAARLDYIPKSLMRAMKRYGGKFSQLRKKKHPAYIRAESAEWDRVVKAQKVDEATRETLDQAAARHGGILAPSTIRIWLKRSGWVRDHRYLIPRAAVDAAIAFRNEHYRLRVVEAA